MEFSLAMFKRKFQEEQLRKQEDSVEKQESMKRGTIDYQAQLAHANALKEIEAKMLGRAKAERENHDIRMERMRAEAVEHRETVLSSIKLKPKLLLLFIFDL